MAGAEHHGELLKRSGLTAPRRKVKRVPDYGHPLTGTEGPNEVWSADYKGYFYCGDRSRCDALTISDHYSRYLLRCQSVQNLSQPYAGPV